MLVSLLFYALGALLRVAAFILSPFALLLSEIYSLAAIEWLLQRYVWFGELIGIRPLFDLFAETGFRFALLYLPLWIWREFSIRKQKVDVKEAIV